MGGDLGIPVADKAAVKLQRRRVLGIRSVRVQEFGKVGHVDLLLRGNQHFPPATGLEKIAPQTPSRMITVGFEGNASRDIRKDRPERRSISIAGQSGA